MGSQRQSSLVRKFEHFLNPSVPAVRLLSRKAPAVLQGGFFTRALQQLTFSLQLQATVNLAEIHVNVWSWTKSHHFDFFCLTKGEKNVFSSLFQKLFFLAEKLIWVSDWNKYKITNSLLRTGLFIAAFSSLVGSSPYLLNPFSLALLPP